MTKTDLPCPRGAHDPVGESNTITSASAPLLHPTSLSSDFPRPENRAERERAGWAWPSLAGLSRRFPPNRKWSKASEGEAPCAGVRKAICVISALSKSFAIPARLPASHPEKFRLWESVILLYYNRL